MDSRELPETNQSNLASLLRELLQAGETPNRSLLDRVLTQGGAAVPSLIDMATNEQLLDAESERPEVWAPLHAVRLLGELAAADAVAPLLPLLERVDDEYLAEALPGVFGQIGEPAFAPLRDFMFDRDKDVWARVRAAEGLGQIAARHPETRAEVISALAARLDPAESRVPDDEILNGSVVSALVELKAVEAASAIRRAFEEDRVDTSIVGYDEALADLGLPPRPRSAKESAPEGLRLRLRCTACGYEREHRVAKAYYDLATQDRKDKGEAIPYDPFIIPQRIVCPKCGAVDQYQQTGDSSIALIAEMLKKVGAHQRGAKVTGDEGPLRVIRFRLTDGREMHPREALDMYRRQVAAEPDRADLRVRYANVLSFMDYRDEAIEQYRAALEREPTNLDAAWSLGHLARLAGDRTEARRMFERVLAQAPRVPLPRRERDEYVAAARDELAELAGRRAHPVEGARLERMTPLPPARATGTRAPTSASGTIPKVGRNDPCPCGSGKKYKKCHGR